MNPLRWSSFYIVTSTLRTAQDGSGLISVGHTHILLARTSAHRGKLEKREDVVLLKRVAQDGGGEGREMR